MEGWEILPPSGLALDLAASSVCSVYDCGYVASARHHGIKLVTCDHKILRKFPETAGELDALSGSP
jgi:predicted nucleic acid-binding protein